MSGPCKTIRIGLIVATLLATIIPGSAQGAGLLVADGGFGGVLEIKEHVVNVTINNGIAVTQVDQVFLNTENRQVEALYTFPVPKGASVANFSMWINGKEMIGEVVEKQRARQIYESYKAARRDPGLLEQIDYKTFEMRIFPIAAGAEQRVRISYYQELDFDHDWATYVYPLATVTRRGIDQSTTGRFALNVRVLSEVPILQMQSPSHSQECVIAQHTRKFNEASLEVQGGDLSRDVVIAYHLSRPHTGIDLITSRPKGEDGYFMLTLTAGEELATFDQAMDYVFILDVSGSMAHDGKLAMSTQSIGSFIDELGPQDRFELITFNVAPNPLFSKLQLADDDAKTQARTFLRSQQARGGTVLAPAMTTAYKYADADRPLNVVILSDGMTEQKERRILLEQIRQRPANARVFAIGVGNEVNRGLLSQLAEDAGGLAAFISRGDNFERQAKAFRRKLTRPVATDLRIELAGVETYDIEPAVLPNLYHGAPVRLYGRYRGKGEAKVNVNAVVAGRPMEQVVAVELPDSRSRENNNPEIERMWAWHRVQNLLKQADRSGSRTGVIEQIVGLGEGYSIVTEYTSFIVLENDAEYDRWKLKRRNALRIQRDRAAHAALQDQLQRLRDKATAQLGPSPIDGNAQVGPTVSQRQLAANDLRTNQPQPQQPTQSPRSRNLNFGGRGGGAGGNGGGAIDPLTGLIVVGLGGLAVVARRKRRNTKPSTQRDH